MPAPIVQFEIGCRDKERSAAFYSGVFDWRIGGGINDLGMEIADAGLAGHLVALGHEPHNYVLVYAEVEDIPTAIAKAESLGGAKIVGPIPIPGGRRFAWLKDPEGTVIGVLDRKG